MADVPQLRSDLLPVPVAPPGQLFGHAEAVGVAHDLELLRQGFTPPPRTPRVRPRRTRPRRPSGPLRRWWAGSGPVDLWHRVRCHAGHHDLRFAGDGRRCRWCDAVPPA